MARRFIDISVPSRRGSGAIRRDMLPQIEYVDHHQIGAAHGGVHGRRGRALPEGEYAAVERANISTHNGTHLDAPYHYFSRMNHALGPAASRPGGSTRCRWSGASSPA